MSATRAASSPLDQQSNVLAVLRPGSASISCSVAGNFVYVGSGNTEFNDFPSGILAKFGSDRLIFMPAEKPLEQLDLDRPNGPSEKTQVRARTQDVHRDPGQIEDALRASFIFPVLGPPERESFITAARQRSWHAGEPIFHMGDVGTSMMLVQTGEVRISYPSADGRTALLAELKPGAVFGEVALLDGGERSADATAVTNCTLLVFERRGFIEMLENNWTLAEAVLKLVCARLRRSDERMADLAFFDLPSWLAKTLTDRPCR